MPDAELGADAVDLLRELLRIDTVNPPGNEGEAQEALRDRLAASGLECELLAADRRRPNLVARLPGREPGPTLALISHVDTVPADPSEWTRDPWSGDLVDGEIWGRGALDMKDQVAAEAAACTRLAAEGWRPARGELLLVVAADEEAGALRGAQWLCAEHPEKVRADLVVNEGAGMRIELGGRRRYTLSVGEKGVFRMYLRTRGVAGHGSLPHVGENALLKLAPLLQRLSTQPPPDESERSERSEEARAVLAGLLGDGADRMPLPEALARIRDADSDIAACLVEPMLGVTLAPTKARASESDNVIPSVAEVLIDCRVPPGKDEDLALARAREVLGEGAYELELAERAVGNRSSTSTPLWDAIAAWIDEVDPGAEPLPIVMAGFSDSHWWRKAFGSVVYGFCPQNAMTLAEEKTRVHAPDERIPVADVELMARFFCDLPQRVLA